MKRFLMLIVSVCLLSSFVYAAGVKIGETTWRDEHDILHTIDWDSFVDTGMMSKKTAKLVRRIDAYDTVTIVRAVLGDPDKGISYSPDALPMGGALGWEMNGDSVTASFSSDEKLELFSVNGIVFIDHTEYNFERDVRRQVYGY